MRNGWQAGRLVLASCTWTANILVALLTLEQQLQRVSKDIWIEEHNGKCTFNLANHSDDLSTEKKFKMVFNKVNRSASMKPADPNYQSAYNNGPILYKALVIDPNTGKTIDQLGGLQANVT